MSLFWALNYPLIKIAVLFQNEFYVIFFRVLFGFILSIILFPKSIMIEKSLKLHFKLFVVSMLNIVGFMELWFIGEMGESASISSIIIYSYPILIVLLSVPFLKEKIGIMNIIGSITALIGIILIFFQEIEIKYSAGLIFLFLGALSWSFGTIIYKKYLNGIEPIKVNTMQLFYALPVTLIIALYSGPIIINNLNIEFFIITLYMGIFGTAIAYFIFLYLYRKYNVSKISSFLFIVPTFTVIISAVFLNESLTAINMLGFIFIILGIYLSQKNY